MGLDPQRVPWVQADARSEQVAYADAQYILLAVG
jgi:hypothetical protein